MSSICSDQYRAEDLAKAVERCGGEGYRMSMAGRTFPGKPVDAKRIRPKPAADNLDWLEGWLRKPGQEFGLWLDYDGQWHVRWPRYINSEPDLGEGAGETEQHARTDAALAAEAKLREEKGDS